MDGIDGEGRFERMSPKGIKRKPSKSFNQDFPTAFYYNYQRVISIIAVSYTHLLNVPVINLEDMNKGREAFNKAINFLTGDNWDIHFIQADSCLLYTS